ncbi:MAG: hypothetical protein ABTD50_00480 [Polyangiaceae bacterium]|jgi:hypothetical protein
MRATFLVLVSLLFVVFARPATAVDLSASGRARFVIADCGNARLELRFTSPRSPLAVRTGDIAPHGAGQPVAWSVAWDKPALSDASIREYAVTGSLENGCPSPGTYAVPLVVTLPIPMDGGASADATADGAALDALPTATLSIEIVRTVDPVLDVPSAVTLPVEAWPVLGPDSGLTVPLRETSNLAPIRSISASGAELKTSSGDPTGIQLVPQAEPLALDAGAGAGLEVSLSSGPPPGTYTSRLVVHAPDTKRDQSVDVTLRVRLSWVFLIGILALGIALGWVVNVWLAGRSALDAARLRGLRAADDLVARASKEADPVVEQRIMGVAVDLETKSRSARTVDAIETATAADQALVTKIEQDARASEARLTSALGFDHAILASGGAGLDTAIANLVAPVSQDLAAIESARDAGRVEAAQARLTIFDATLQRRLTSVLGQWLMAAWTGLTDLHSWPASDNHDTENRRSSLIVRVETALRAQGGLGALMGDANSAAHDLRGWISFHLPFEIAQAFHEAESILRSGGRGELADTMSSLAAEALQQHAVTADPVANLVVLATIRGRAERELEAAALPAARRQVELAVAKGEFANAAALLAPQTATPRSAIPHLTRTGSVRPAQPGDGASSPAMPEQPTLWPIVVLPVKLEVGQAANVTLDWGGSAGPHPKGATWSADPESAADIRGDDETATVTPRKPGFIQVRVQFSDKTHSVARAWAGDITASPDYRGVEADRFWVGLVTGIVATALTLCAGYQIFIGTWLGTFGDFFYAFLWGFFGQFGLDRLRTLAQPTVSKALP